MGTQHAESVTATSDLHGLICAFELAPLQVRGGSVLSDGTSSPVWLHFNLTDSRACRWIAASDLPADAKELLLDPEPRSRSLVTGEGLAAGIVDLHHDYRGDPEDFGSLRIYIDARRIVTARSHPLRSSDRLRHELLRAEGEPRSPVEILDQLLGCFAETFAHTVAGLADDTDDAEEEVLAGRFAQRGRSLGQMRRLLARLRRQITANRSALAALPSSMPEPCTADQRHSLRAAVDRFDAIAQDLELVQERARLVQEELAGRLGEATNRNLFLLSIVTTTLLPITLITGVFGMNVGGLPWVSDGAGFWWVLLLMSGSVLTVLLILRHRRVL